VRHPLRRHLGSAKWHILEACKTLSYRLSLPWSRNFINNFWENQADMIYERWGALEHDYEILSRLFTTYRPCSILDVGCGSGRLFKLYAQHQIQDVIGIDISHRALDLARRSFPLVQTLCSNIEDLEFPPNRFDFAICNRVLQHIPARDIAGTVAKLSELCQHVYINELTSSDNLNENFYMIRHDYAALFAHSGFRLLEEGSLGEQTFELYGRM
jgi:2-polyprenyl-3-methyl-5-hydroxy-6-metoxy-1,4-benzoquinol methylase